MTYFILVLVNYNSGVQCYFQLEREEKGTFEKSEKWSTFT